MHAYFVLLADCTAGNIVLDKSVHSRPPVILSYCLYSLELSRMSHDYSVVELLYNVSSKLRIH